MKALKKVHADHATAGLACPSVSDRRFALLGNLMLAIAMIGYPLSAVASILIGVESRSLNIVYRIVVLVASFYLTAWTIRRGQYRLNFLVFVFFGFYTIRLLIDIAYSRIPNVEDDAVFFLAAVLAPVLALGGGHAWYDQKTLAKLICWVGGFGALLIIYVLIFQPDEALSKQMGGRASLQLLNPISISYHGLYVSTAALILLTSTRGMRKRLILGAVIMLGGYLLMAGGSRGPLVALIIAIGLTGIANSRAARSYIALAITILPFLLALGAPELIIERFVSAGEDTSSLERFQLFQLSLQLAIDHPYFGYAYIEPTTRAYPHNLLVESAMALGILGAVLMFAMQISLLRAAWNLSKHGEWLIAVFATVALVNAWISGAVWGSSVFFATVWLANARIHSRALVNSESTETPKLAIQTGR